jgi:hypothetical protein
MESKKEKEMRQWELAEREAHERPRYYAGLGRWHRFSKYILVRDEHNNLAIAPAPDSTMEFYRPFDQYPQILIDYLSLADFITRKSTDLERQALEEILNPDIHYPNVYYRSPEEKNRLEQDAPRILGFCNQYGTTRMDSSKRWRYWDLESVLVPTIQMPRRKSQTDSQYKADQIKREQYFIHQFRNEKSFVASWHHHCVNILDWAENWKIFRNGEFAPDDNNPNAPRTTWRDTLSGIYAFNVQLSIGYKNSWQIDYEFDSLLDALNIMFVLNVTSENQQVRLCKREGCRKAFLARNSRSLYCSDKCLSRDKVRKWRANNKTKTVDGGSR